MASVVSIYSRAFADVVFESRLDAAKTLDQLHLLSSLLRANRDLRRVWENPAIMNRARQAKITKEIIEIVSGAAAQ